jgi:hypothetical protein
MVYLICLPTLPTYVNGTSSTSVEQQQQKAKLKLV